MLKSSRTAEVILSALPYIQKFRDKIFVIKYGGAAQIDDKLKDSFARDIVLLQIVGIKVILVHGGGKTINSFLDRLEIKSEFINGLRVTDSQTMQIVEMALSGLVNKEITSILNKHGARAIGVSGKDDNMLKAKAMDNGKYGYVGDITSVDDRLINSLLDDGLIPVIAPIAIGENYESYNINADLCASTIASKLRANKVIFLSDIKGVLDKNSNLIGKLNENSINELKKDGTISGGMIPKIDACLECIRSGVGSAHIIDGRIPHSLLLEIFTDEGIGSIIQ
ncbi:MULTISPECIES: acetylglutamate kinase [Campylobacter]|uniref:acetylglutamate kinase n=1 Tax=Campylobacter TaxID=194 RepID=UPI000A33FB7A|nr:acetylglutamate kinase [Campylobacter sp. P0024]MCR8678486.1 acetylglutamate kinase [Campylobacter sp. RM19072]